MKKIVFFLFPIINCLLISSVLSDETITIATYYPSPSGVYNELLVNQRMAIGDVNGDGVINDFDMAHDNSGSPMNGTLTVANSLGIGTNNPQATLDVEGGVRVGAYNNASTTCLTAESGTIRYNAPNVEYCNGTNWLRVNDAGFTNFQVFNCANVGSDCAAQWIVPTGVTRIMVEVWGGGGGGARDDGNGGAPGCGGAYGKDIFAVTAGTVYSINVGGGGSRGVAGNSLGTNGGDSKVVTGGVTLISANGGGAGPASPNPCSQSGGCNPGSSTATINITGGYSNGYSALIGGDGANGGAGGRPMCCDNCLRKRGRVPGGGGAGGYDGYSGYKNGGEGAPGRVIIWW